MPQSSRQVAVKHPNITSVKINLSENWQMVKWWARTVCGFVKPQWSEPRRQVFWQTLKTHSLILIVLANPKKSSLLNVNIVKTQHSSQLNLNIENLCTHLSLNCFRLNVSHIVNSTVRTVCTRICSWLLMLIWWVCPIDSGVPREDQPSSALLWTLISLSHAHAHAHWPMNSSHPRGVCILKCYECWRSVRKQPWSSSLTASLYCCYIHLLNVHVSVHVCVCACMHT